MERPVVMYSAALRFLAAAAECSTKENKDPPSLEDVRCTQTYEQGFSLLATFLEREINGDNTRNDLQ